MSSSFDPENYVWPPDELARFKAYMGEAGFGAIVAAEKRNGAHPPHVLNGASHPPERASIGHNSSNADPGADRGYRIGFRIPEWVSRAKVRAFEKALQEQGSYPDRLAALDQSAWRVRASRSFNPAEFRLYSAVLDVSKGEHRCSLFDLDKIAYVAGITDRSNAAKLVNGLEEKKAVVALRFTEGSVNASSSRKVLIAPIIAAEDRGGVTSTRIYAEMEEAKVAKLAKQAEDARNRHRKHQQAASRGEEHHEKEPRGEEYHEGPNHPCDVNALALSRGEEHHENAASPSRGEIPKSRGEEHHILLSQGSSQEDKRGANAPPLPFDDDKEEAGHSGATPERASKADCKKSALRRDARAAFDLYVETAKRCGLAVPLSAEPWLPNVGARLRESGGLDGWKAMLARLEQSRFLCGENDRNFAADLDWLVKPKNFEKIRSGKYDDRRSGSGLRKSPTGGVF